MPGNARCRSHEILVTRCYENQQVNNQDALVWIENRFHSGKCLKSILYGTYLHMPVSDGLEILVTLSAADG